MQTHVVAGPYEAYETDALVLGIFDSGDGSLTGPEAALDAALDGGIRAVLTQGDFKGKRNEVLVFYTHGLIPAKRVLLVGLGKRDKLTPDVIRQAAATAAKKARDLGAASLSIGLFGVDDPGLSPEGFAQAVAEGVRLGLYRFEELKTRFEGRRPDPERLDVLTPDRQYREALEEGLRTGTIIAESALLARDLVNRPGNIATPSHMVETARQVAADTGLAFRVIEKDEMEALGMGLLLSVNRGSEEPARLAVLEHHGAGGHGVPTVVLVGKGITFDTGGISLKPSANMEAMKGDMGGAAAVIGALRAAALLDLPLHVVGLTPFTDNMPDACATKPGDVVRSLKGLTVEIINTDAEGRLILADALTHAGEFAPSAIFDIATLTGGRIVALGAHAAAVMGDETLIESLRRAGDATGERVWPLPLFEAYGEQIESETADLKNVGGREASTIIGGFFLSKFVPEGVPWVHIDIAGLGLVDKTNAYTCKGGTGFGVRLLVEMLRQWHLAHEG